MSLEFDHLFFVECASVESRSGGGGILCNLRYGSSVCGALVCSRPLSLEIVIVRATRRLLRTRRCHHRRLP